jgi:hypothetical protein
VEIYVGEAQGRRQGSVGAKRCRGFKWGQRSWEKDLRWDESRRKIAGNASRWNQFAFSEVKTGKHGRVYNEYLS